MKKGCQIPRIFKGPSGTTFLQRPEKGSVLIFGMRGTEASIPVEDLSAFCEEVGRWVLQEYGLLVSFEEEAQTQSSTLPFAPEDDSGS
jgi:hypothetical protein